MPEKIPFRRGDTVLEGVSGAKAVLVGFRYGANI